MQTKDFKGQNCRGRSFNAGFNRGIKMNIAEQKLSLFHQIDELSEESLLAVENLIVLLKSKQNSKRQLVKSMQSVWLGIQQWREQAQFQENDEILTDEMVASWRDKSTGRDFSWNS